MIYWLTGIIGAGKSTLGAALAASLPQTRFIDGDYYGTALEQETFAQKIDRKHELLAKACVDAVIQNTPLVVTYPLDAARAKTLKAQLPPGHLIIIGLAAPVESGTRTYSGWENKRRNEMTACSGEDFADIKFTHPSVYLHDSVAALLQRLAKA